MALRDGVRDFTVFGEFEAGGRMHASSATTKLVRPSFAQFAAWRVQLVLCFDNANPTQHSVGACSTCHTECPSAEKGENWFHSVCCSGAAGHPAFPRALRLEQKTG